MKVIVTALVLWAAFFAAGVQAAITATIDESKLTYGDMSVWDLNDGYLWSSGWAIPDLRATFDASGSQVTMAPVIQAGSLTDPYWYNGQDGQKKMEALLHQNVDSAFAGQTVTFKLVVTSNTLTSAHEATAFIRDFDSGYWNMTETSVPLTTNGTYTVQATLSPDMTHHFQYGVRMYGVNVYTGAVGEAFGYITVEAVPDTEAPTPNPMQFGILPHATGDSSISMTATNATDDLSGVEYYFTCANGGGHDSGWQSNPTYEDTGLVPDSIYYYTVKARDTSSNTNETAESAAEYALTLFLDSAAPSPDPMSFAAAPTASGPNSVIMRAATATDESGVEYYFTCTAGGGHDSGWQAGPSYEDTGLNPGTEYSYAVMARDLSTATNTTAASSAASATTPILLKWMSNSLTNYTGTTTNESTRIALGSDSLEQSVATAIAKVGFGSAGATFGDGTDYHGRNVLRTIAQNYDLSSFEAYATFVFDGASDQAAFIGLGQGIIAADVNGNWGVPELALGGVNGVVAEIKTSLSAGDQASKLHKIVDGSIITSFVDDPMANSGAFRVRLAYDAVAATATVSIDTNYVGGAFVEDMVLGTIDTSGSGGTNMWYGAPVRVYVGGGEGTVVRDLVIAPTSILISGYEPIPGTGVAVSWDAQQGAIYNVEYATNLVDGIWYTDPSPGCSAIYALSGGGMSVTSTVDAAEVFFRLMRE